MNRPVSRTHPFPCGRVNRRAFLADVGMGFTGLALGSMLHSDGITRAEATAKHGLPSGEPHFKPKAKNVIWLFMLGGVLWPVFTWLRGVLGVDKYPVGSAMAIGGVFGGLVVTAVGYVRMAIFS